MLNTFDLKSENGKRSQKNKRSLHIDYIWNFLQMIFKREGGVQLPDNQVVEATGRSAGGGFCQGQRAKGGQPTLLTGLQRNCGRETGRIHPGSFWMCRWCATVAVPHSRSPVSPQESANNRWRGSGCLHHAEEAQLLLGLHDQRCCVPRKHPRRCARPAELEQLEAYKSVYRFIHLFCLIIRTRETRTNYSNSGSSGLLAWSRNCVGKKCTRSLLFLSKRSVVW